MGVPPSGGGARFIGVISVTEANSLKNISKKEAWSATPVGCSGRKTGSGIFWSLSSLTNLLSFLQQLLSIFLICLLTHLSHILDIPLLSILLSGITMHCCVRSVKPIEALMYKRVNMARNTFLIL
jgi:hypothetical protein